MNDQELLTLTAKAVGKWSGLEPFEHVLDRWNPLADDGDALRVAVMLGFINPGQWPSVSHVADRMLRETNNVDWYAATRRAIVQAAAEIGRSLK